MPGGCLGLPVQFPLQALPQLLASAKQGLSEDGVVRQQAPAWSTVWSTVTGVEVVCGSRGRTYIAVVVADPWSSLLAVSHGSGCMGGSANAPPIGRALTFFRLEHPQCSWSLPLDRRTGASSPERCGGDLCLWRSPRSPARPTPPCSFRDDGRAC